MPTAEAIHEVSGKNPAHSNALAKLFARVGELTTLPHQATRLLSLTADQSSSIDDMVSIISSDPPTSMRVLRRVNSAYYGLPNQVSDLRLAVSLLGTRELRNIALTASMSRVFAGNDPAAEAIGYSREELWRHSVAVATASSVIATTVGQVSPSDAYAAGLLHDIGYFLLDQHLHKHYLEFIAAARQRCGDELPTTALEVARFSFHHAALGGYVAAAWGLPAQVRDAIEYHHDHQRYEGEHGALLATVVLANSICGHLGWTSLGFPNAPCATAEVLEQAGVDEAIFERVQHEVTLALEDIAAAATSR